MGWSTTKRAISLISAVGIISAITLLTGATEETQSTPTGAPAKTIVPYQVKSLSIPSAINFAGENFPVTRFDIRERFDRELLSNSYFHSNTILLIKRANRYFPIIEPILKKNNIPDDFKYIAMIESSFQPRVVSPSGAAGIWQFLKSTGIEYGLEVNNLVDERYHVEKATEAACKYLQKAHDAFGNWSLAAASYNAGMNRISKEIERQKNNDYCNLLLPDETKRYVFRALALKEIFQNPSKYGFVIHAKDLYPQLAYKEVMINSELKNLVEFAADHNVSYYMLKEFNPWLRDDYLPNSTKKMYKIQIPTIDALSEDPNKIEAHNTNWVVND